MIRYMTVSEPATVIRKARAAAGLTQQQLAARAGLRQPNIAAYETGARIPSQRMVGRILRAAPSRPSLLLREHRDEVMALAGRFRAERVRVFGSVACGQDTADSDLDLLVTFRPGADIFDQGGLTAALEALLGRRVDVVSEGALGERDRDILEMSVPL